ncbi:MAG: hypothetical protein RLZZ450_1398 [Pseudomonadota bacterium]|jgi:hypothetical protein
MSLHDNEQGADADQRRADAIYKSAETIVRRELAVAPPARRDQHAKHHGSLWAYFDVLPDAPAHLRHGLFAQPGHYRAWVRFSNSNTGSKPDTTLDGRGVAIKLLDVPGRRRDSQDVGDRGPQDFILLNHSAFFARDLEDMQQIFAWQAAGKFLPFYFFRHFRRHGLWAIAKLATRPDSPLDLTYYSQLPFAYDAERAIKYRLRPLTGVERLKPTPAEKRSKDHLRHVLRRQLRPNEQDRSAAQQSIERTDDSQPGDAVFAFEVQPQTAGDDLERGDVSWTGPFTPVALLRIPRQDFDHPERMAFAENMSFSVWNSLQAHTPLGRLNWARGPVYARVQALRNVLNRVQPPVYSAEEWLRLRALPPGPEPALDELADVMATLTPPVLGLPTRLLRSRLGPYVPALLLVMILSCVVMFSNSVGKPLSLDFLTLPSERLIPTATYSTRYLDKLRKKRPGYDPEGQADDAVWLFRYGSMGAEFSAGIPYWIYRALPRIAPDKFDDKGDWSTFGLTHARDDDEYYADYHGLPRGLVLSDTIVRFGNHDLGVPLKRVALNCSSCHRGEFIDREGKSQFIDGMPNLAFDAAAFKRQTVAAFTDARFTVARVLGAIDEVLAEEHHKQNRSGEPPRLTASERLIYTRMVQFIQAGSQKKEELLGWQDRRPDNGPGRLDAFGALRFESLGFVDPLPSDGAAPQGTPQLIATVDLPSIWNQSPRDRPRHHYDGNTADARARNVGAIVGVGGHPLSVRYENVKRIGEWIDNELKPAPYPFGSVDRQSAAVGQQIYEAQCAGCHGRYDRAGQLVSPTKCMSVATEDLARTDSERARAVDQPFVEKLNQFGVRNGLWETTSFSASRGYLCPPLDGIWARAPYLHNGSVPTLDHLLRKPEERPAKFLRGNPRYDTEHGGFVFDEASVAGRSLFTFDTSAPGNSNQGHDRPEQLVLDATQRRFLIAYLYSL